MKRAAIRTRSARPFLLFFGRKTVKIKEPFITSRTNPLICEISSLLKKKERDESGRFLCDGKKLTFEYIKKCGVPAHIFVCEKGKDISLASISELEKSLGYELEITLVGESAFMKMTEQKAPDGIICVGEKSRLGHVLCDIVRAEDIEGERVFILSSLQDSGNVGTVLRSALAFGYDRVILSSDCADIYSPKTLRAAMGATFSLKISVCSDLESSVADICIGRRVFAGELRENSVSLESLNINDSDIFIVGNEGHGISVGISEKCTGSVYIPISEHSESLNASIAATVFMWHQRTMKG